MDGFTLSDGTEVEIRPIRPDDGERLQVSYARLSTESRYRRFLGPKPTLTKADVRYLAEIDGSNHVALVATAPVHGQEGTIIAVARFIRLQSDPSMAEFAIVVGDDYQRQGLGTELVKRLAAAAAARGIRRFSAMILSDNVAIYRLMEKLSQGPMETAQRGSVTEVEFELPARTEARPLGATCAGP